MSNRRLVEEFDSWREHGEALVLATVIETEGSTYSKTGRQMLMQSNGSHAGLISGGCLEGDLASHAQEVLNNGEPRIVTYDMRDDADDLWGIGLGCNGLMRLLLQKIAVENNWQPFASIRDALASPAMHNIELVIESSLEQLPLGTCLINGKSVDNMDNNTDTGAATGKYRVCGWQSQPWIRLLILGGTPDAEPVAQLAHATGWEVTIGDHREHYLSTNDFSCADTILLTEPDRLNEQTDLSAFDAIIVMSHHLETDRKYLQQLVNSPAGYIGLLGPVKRKQKLLSDLPPGGNLAERLRGPVGLEIGADSPETIALALIAEIQSLHNN